ncbi:MAG: NAD(P)-dependent oxidoreductase [Gammaproteobacteria bacterium]|nr:NAD(P)-dependent oxidoreductase [Gammaproteobacteria bacterium]NIR82216.1 NAD(P)-dependent oxidoreductase [Gammaproteobacteria bacterium]NIR90815.1 NAD(P)-dependent oxidoreductase [Gammaproteobacteria bacterium]NIU03366.1 NAD(P)-dependent oxidoreductase [Gammaproteobacteria bacterium]NIV50862.1 NAD-binding protein [Gammaproteobacteria bacterium]
MGHGIARNLLQHGFPLSFLAHPGNRPVDDLLALGAGSAPTAAGVTRAADVVFLCVTGSPQVEDVMFKEDGVLQALRRGQLVVDCSTAQPASTQRVARAVTGKGARFLDAPLTRTPKEAEAGRLNVMVGGDPGDIEAVRPLLDAFAENVYHAGPVGGGHKMKLLHNFISLGNAALLAEAVSCARKAQVDMQTFTEVLASGGGDSVVLRRLMPYILEGDDSGFRFSLANGAKDLGYYTAMADELRIPSFAAHAVQQVYALAQALEHGAQSVPTLMDILSDLPSQRRSRRPHR